MKYSEQDVERILINSSFTNSEHKEALRARLFGSSSELSDTKAQIVNLFDNKEFVDRLMQTSGEEEIARMFSENNVEISKDCNNHSMTRGVSLQVTYNFNTTRSKYKGTGAGNEEKNRL